MPVKGRRSRVPPRAGRGSRGRALPHADLVRVLLADSEAGVLLVDSSGRVADLNATAAGLFGVPAARLKGARAAELLKTVVAGDDPMREAFRRATSEREAVLAAGSGAELPVLLRSFRIGDPPWI